MSLSRWATRLKIDLNIESNCNLHYTKTLIMIDAVELWIKNTQDQLNGQLKIDVFKKSRLVVIRLSSNKEITSYKAPFCIEKLSEANITVSVMKTHSWRVIEIEPAND